MTHSIHHDLEIVASADKVFQAISEPQHLVNWWPLRCTGLPKDKGKYNFYFSPEYDWHGVVTKVKKNMSFHIKMTKADEDWSPTSFGFDLVPQDKGVLLKFWHVGWPACNAHFRRSSFCWAILLKGLKDYTERGIIVPFEERE
ncbi:MAG: SRPBCC domain-containing protein [Bacteroidota bacterium]